MVNGLYEVVATDNGLAGLGSAWLGIAVSEDGSVEYLRADLIAEFDMSRSRRAGWPS